MKKTDTFTARNVEELAVMNDEDLYNSYMKFDDMKRISERRGDDTAHIETELCYISRELEVRNLRKKAHQQFLANLGVKHYPGVKN